MADAARRARVQELLDAAARLASPTTSEGQRLRERLLDTTGLSRPSIELALERCLERSIDARHMTSLLARVPEAPRALVLLSGNVFVAALRAIALARAASAQVVVRASRRDPALAEALAELVPGAFELVTELQPQAGDHVWAYGSDDTLAQVRAGLPPGAMFHGHGSGLGAVVVEEGVVDMRRAVSAIALDTALFDQRGCLSPRLVVVQGEPGAAQRWAEELAPELSRLERELPPGAENDAETAARRRELDAATYAFEVRPAGRGWVSFSPDGRAALPPATRSLHVVATLEPSRALAPFQRHLTCLGRAVSDTLATQLERAFPGARHCELGRMQAPPLDGPVDLRGYAA